MPDSPADVKTQARSTPPSMPPPPAATQGATRHPSFTPSTSEYHAGDGLPAWGHAASLGMGCQLPSHPPHTWNPGPAASSEPSAVLAVTLG